MTEKRFTIKKSGKGLFYSDGDYSIDNTIQFVIETVESKLNQLNDENNELKSRVCECHTFLSSKTRIIENSNEELRKENEQLKQRITELELLNDGLNYALQNIRKIDVEIDLNE